MVAAAVCLFSLLCASLVAAETISVPAGGDLQQAITSAEPGDTILLQPGATYVGNFTLPNKDGASFITVETSPAGLPGGGARITPGKAKSHVVQNRRSVRGQGGA